MMNAKIPNTRATVLVVAASALALVVLLFISYPVSGSHGGQSDTWVLDSSEWRACVNTNSSGATQGWDHARSQFDSISNISASSWYCNDPGYNVNWNSGNYGVDNWYGSASCTDWGSYPDCYHNVVRINDERISGMQDPQRQYNKTSCHELGHVGGLGHRGVETSCMSQGSSPPISEYLDAHDRTAVYDTYD